MVPGPALYVIYNLKLNFDILCWNREEKGCYKIITSFKFIFYQINYLLGSTVICFDKPVYNVCHIELVWVSLFS